jgi:hypothetical protein
MSCEYAYFPFCSPLFTQYISPLSSLFSLYSLSLPSSFSMPCFHPENMQGALVTYLKTKFGDALEFVDLSCRKLKSVSSPSSTPPPSPSPLDSLQSPPPIKLKKGSITYLIESSYSHLYVFLFAFLLLIFFHDCNGFCFLVLHAVFPFFPDFRRPPSLFFAQYCNRLMLNSTPILLQKLLSILFSLCSSCCGSVTETSDIFAHDDLLRLNESARAKKVAMFFLFFFLLLLLLLCLCIYMFAHPHVHGQRRHEHMPPCRFYFLLLNFLSFFFLDVFMPWTVGGDSSRYG